MTKHFFVTTYMRFIIFKLLLILCTGKIYAQNDSCKSKLTEAEIINIAKKKRAYRDEIEQPKLYFSERYCEWEVESKIMRKSVKRHGMIHTKLVFLSLCIDAETGKVKSRERDVHLVPYGEP